MDEIEKILSEGEKETPVPPSGEKSPEDIKNEESAELEKQLENRRKAIDEAKAELRRLRSEIKVAKPEPEVIPKIDFEDPNSKAWDGHIRSSVDPLRQELEREKEENRSLALDEFITDFPDLAKTPDKVKILVESYDRLSKGKITEKNVGVIKQYLRKAYNAEFGDEEERRANEERIKKARAESSYSSPAITRGATSYPTQRQAEPHISEDERRILERWDSTLGKMGIK